jgi:exopolysaccharide biosynthesis polyprenyl glycosylphosphotransferase
MIIGSGVTSLKIIEDLQQTGSDFFQIVGVYNGSEHYKGKKVCEIEVRGTVKNFLNDIKDNPPQLVVVSFEHELTPEWTDALLKCGRMNINVYSAADVYGKIFGKVPSDHIDAIWLLSGMNNIRKPYLIFKRVLDIFFAVTGLLIMAVLFPFLFIIMKITSPGPVFFSQKRVGLLGKEFKIYKFRTMIVNAENNTGAVWCTEQDKRITPLGRFMRKVRIDELPQFWNILKGDMSLIGPRPERPEFVEMLKKRIPFYDERHLVKPGLTGWAQVLFPYGNSVEDSAHKLHYDLFYIRNMSIFMDMKIVLKTVSTILEAKGGM